MNFTDVESIMDYCENNKIYLWMEGEKLKYRTVGVTISPELMTGLKMFKPDILLRLGNFSGEIKIDPQNRYEPFPVSDVQAAYLLGRNATFQYGNVACHIYLELTYDKLMKEEVRRAWECLIRRHDMLRAVINPDGSQIVLKHVPELEIPYFDVSKETCKGADGYIESMKHQICELGKWPMFGVALSDYPDKTILHFSIEFLIADWTSIWMLLWEFEKLYFNPAIELPSIDIQFRDYILQERTEKKGVKYEQDKAYWLEKIEQLPSAPELPLINISNEGKEFRRKSLMLSPEKWQAFKNNAKQYGVTPTTAALEAYSQVLERWSGNKRFCINLSVLNRKPVHPDIEKVVGDFTTIALITIDHTKKNSFAKGAKKTNMELFDTLDHGLYSGVEVLRELARRNKGNKVLMPIVFTSAIGLLGKNSQLIGRFEKQGISQTPQVFIDCQVMDGNFGLQANWDYREGLFPEGMIDDMFQAFENLLQALSETEKNWEATEEIVKLPKWQLEERDRVNHTYVKRKEKLLYEDFLENVRKWPNNVAVIDGKGEYTYYELDSFAKTIASALKKYAVNTGDNVPIIMKKSRYQAAAALGILYMGGAYVPIEADQALKRQDEILKDLEAKVILTTRDVDRQKREGIKKIYLDDLENSAYREDFCILKQEPSARAYIIYTSGSTGKPKGVVISHRAACNTIEDVNLRFEVGKNDRIFGISKLNFDLSVYDLFGLLAAGGTIIYPKAEEYRNPKHWIELIEKYDITMWNSVPALMNLLLNYQKDTSVKLGFKKVFLSGDWIPLDMPKRIEKVCPEVNIICMGGATEAAIWSNFYKYMACEEEVDSIPYGIPLTNQSFMIVNEDMENCPVWVKGNIYILGNGLADEYYKATELTNKKFLVHPQTKQRIYKTGDVGRYLPGGNMEFLGRIDNQVKIYGHRIELGEIEKKIEASDGISSCVVLAKNNEIHAVIEVDSKEPAVFEQAHQEFECIVATITTNQDWIYNLNKKECFALEYRKEIVAKSILYCFQKMNTLVAGEAITEEKIIDNFVSLPKYKWLVQPWLCSLVENEQITFDGTVYVAKETIGKSIIDTGWQNMHNYWEETLGDEKIITYIEENAKNISSILKGEMDPLGLLYPDGSNEYVKALYVNNSITTAFNKYMAKFIVKLSEARKEKKLRILEIGAGTGATTRIVLKALKGRNYEYTYTDISKYFFLEAKKRFGNIGNVTFKALDINQDIYEQDFRPNSYDIIIASYVLENANDIEKSLGYVEKLIAPQGYLLFSTPRRDEEWLLASQALMMEKPKDSLRGNEVFISPKKWIEILSKSGDYDDLYCIPDINNEKANKVGLNLFIKPYKQEKSNISGKILQEYLRDFLPDYMIPKEMLFIDKMPLSENGKINRKLAYELFDQYVAKNKKDIEGTLPSTEVQKKLASIFEEILKCKNIFIDDNLYDYGADSLCMAQAVAKIRDTLKQELPFERLLRQILNTPTIRALEEFIAKDNEKQKETIKEEIKPFAYTRDYGGDNGERIRILLHSGLGKIENYGYLGAYLSEQKQGKVLAIGIYDNEKYCSLTEDEILEFLIRTYTNMIIDKGIKKIQLIGYCYSGTIAVEIAKRLIEKGYEVEDVCVIDGGSMPITVTEEYTYEMMFANLIGLTVKDFGFDSPNILEHLMDEMVTEGKKQLKIKDILHFYYKNSGKNPEAIFYWLNKKTQEERFAYYREIYIQKFKKEFDMPAMMQLYQIFKQSFKVYVTPGIYFGNICYYSAKEKVGMYKYLMVMISEWKDICMGDFSITEINGDHFSCIENPNYAHELAELLSVAKKR